jgi:hypothetical protein
VTSGENAFEIPLTGRHCLRSPYKPVDHPFQFYCRYGTVCGPSGSTAIRHPLEEAALS